MTPSPTVALLLKAPIPGTVKTRFAKQVGDQTALDVYRRLVKHQLRQIPDGWPVTIHYAPTDAETRMRNWLGDSFAYVAQPDGDLGVRLTHATAHHFSNPEAGPLFLLGGDCPYLTRARLTEAAESLVTRQVCLWPAKDGGYVLLGLTAPQPPLFTDIAWSTNAVYLETSRRCLDAGLTLRAFHPALEDIDHLGAWQRALATETIRIPESADPTSASLPTLADASAPR